MYPIPLSFGGMGMGGPRAILLPSSSGLSLIRAGPCFAPFPNVVSVGPPSYVESPPSFLQLDDPREDELRQLKEQLRTAHERADDESARKVQLQRQMEDRVRTLQSELFDAETRLEAERQSRRQFEREAQQYAVALADTNRAKQEAEEQVAELCNRLFARPSISASLGPAAAASQQQQQQQMIIQQQRQQIQQLQARQQQIEAQRQRQERPPQAAAATCCVCMDAAPSVLYLPCKHYKVCEGCDRRLGPHGPCPVCRSPVTNRITQLHL
jgi:DNA repair exonuclease SbcCD ATPase subunit